MFFASVSVILKLLLFFVQILVKSSSNITPELNLQNLIKAKYTVDFVNVLSIRGKNIFVFLLQFKSGDL